MNKENDKLLFEEEQMTKRCKEYLELLYNNNTSENLVGNKFEFDVDDLGYSILRDEVDYALRSLTDKKAS